MRFAATTCWTFVFFAELQVTKNGGRFDESTLFNYFLKTMLNSRKKRWRARKISDEALMKTTKL